ncbi:MAG: DUF368 domain-containing protein [Saprospiraceae bacterium]|nr:DUF368 domain-containing protein [Saprospiraceae bacterium]
MKIDFNTVLKGSAMGVAEVIPGVSGGTIAFITGIYEKLLNSIKAFNFELLGSVLKGEFKSVWEKINGWFLLSLGIGMAAGVVAGVFAIDYFIRNYPEPLWGFFFGLIIASAMFIARQVDKWNFFRGILLVVGFIIAYGITVLSPAEGSTAPLYIFLSGVIAICALILPGISGSFMLLLMGMYTIIIPALKGFLQHRNLDNFYIIAFFAAGCLVGMAGFSRVMSWLFQKYKYSTLVVLTGFLIGSLNKIWPWRNVTAYLNKDTGIKTELADISVLQSLDPKSVKILSEINVLPGEYLMDSPKILATILSMVIGFLLVFIFDRKSKSAIL